MENTALTLADWLLCAAIVVIGVIDIFYLKRAREKAQRALDRIEQVEGNMITLHAVIDDLEERQHRQEANRNGNK